MEDAISHAQSSLPAGRFEGRVAFQQLVRDALACAAREGWPELILSDASFHDWPLGERSVADSLQDWARAGRRFVLVAAGFDEIVRRHARFVQWRVRWDHIIVCRKASVADPQDVPVRCGRRCGRCSGTTRCGAMASPAPSRSAASSCANRCRSG